MKGNKKVRSGVIAVSIARSNCCNSGFCGCLRFTEAE